MKWIVRLVALSLVALTVSFAAMSFTTRSRLDESRSAVISEWTALRPDIDARYVELTAANDALRDSGGPTRTVVADIDAALEKWDSLVKNDSDLEDQIRSANELEGLARRLEKVVGASSQIETNKPALGALSRFASLKVDADSLNERIDKFQADLDEALAKIISGSLGFAEIPVLDS